MDFGHVCRLRLSMLPQARWTRSRRQFPARRASRELGGGILARYSNNSSRWACGVAFASSAAKTLNARDAETPPQPQRAGPFLSLQSRRCREHA